MPFALAAVALVLAACAPQRDGIRTQARQEETP